MPLTRRSLLLAAAAAPVLVPLGRGALANTEEQLLVDKAKLTVDEFAANRDMVTLRRLLGRARGALIFPEVFKGGFIIGGEGGLGVLLAKDAGGAWGAPAFYALAAGSIGFQIGAQVSQIVLTIMNDNALNGMFKNEFKAGADAGVAVGPVGIGAEASTTANLRDDIYAFSMNKGLFGGASLEGAGILPRYQRNEKYYGISDPRQIVLGGQAGGAGTDGLRRSLAAAELN